MNQKLFTKSFKIFIFLIFLFLIFLNYKNTKLGFLSIYSLDDYAFHGSLKIMYNGLVKFNLKDLFSYGFYSYGFAFFFINLLGTLPFFVIDNVELTIFVPRLISLTFAMFSLRYIYMLSISYADKMFSQLLLILIITMPGFWKNSTWFHPDWMMTFFTILTIYYLHLDDQKFKKYFWYAVTSFAFAVTTKIQAVTFFPVFIFYVYYSNIALLTFKTLVDNTKILFKSFLVLVLIFVITNPYLVNVSGFKLFITSFKENMYSNATNHGHTNTVSVYDKYINVISFYYYDFILLLALIYSIFKIFFNFIKDKKFHFFYLIFIYFITNIIYLLIYVNKDWHHYYLTLFITSVLLFSPISKIKYSHIILGILIIINFITHLNSFEQFFKNIYHPNIELSLTEEKAQNYYLTNTFKSSVNNNINILVEPFIPFDYTKSGFKYENIHLIYGPLMMYMFEKKAFLEKYQTKDSTKFKNIDYIILSKKSIYFDKNKISKRADSLNYFESNNIINNLNNGNLGYYPTNFNPYFFIWKKKQFNTQ